MTVSEFRKFIQEEALRKFIAHSLEEDFGEQLNSADCMEQPEVCMSKPEQIIDPRPEL